LYTSPVRPELHLTPCCSNGLGAERPPHWVCWKSLFYCSPATPSFSVLPKKLVVEVTQSCSNFGSVIFLKPVLLGWLRVLSVKFKSARLYLWIIDRIFFSFM